MFVHQKTNRNYQPTATQFRQVAKTDLRATVHSSPRPSFSPRIFRCEIGSIYYVQYEYSTCASHFTIVTASGHHILYLSLDNLMARQAKALPFTSQASAQFLCIINMIFFYYYYFSPLLMQTLFFFFFLQVTKVLQHRERPREKINHIMTNG